MVNPTAMPPANSPSENPADPTATSPYLEQLAELASPVPDFAATLTTQAEQDANDRNVNFLRTVDSYSRRRRSPYLSPAEFDQAPARDHIEIETQRRMRRALLQRRRYTPAQLQEIDRQNDTSPAIRTALRQPVTYQGWAPGGSDTEVEDEETTRSRTTTHRQDIDDQSFGPIWRRLQNMQREQLELQLQDSRLNRGQSHFMEDGSGEHTTTDASLRTTALLQSIRRSANRFPPRPVSPNSLYRLQLSILEDQDGAPLTRQRTYEPYRIRAAESLDQEPMRRLYLDSTARDTRARTSEPATQPEVSRWLEEAIKYLERLRYCNTHSERMSSAADSPFLQGQYITPDLGDFLIDTTIIDPPPQSSWLRVGGVFSGSQHASGGCGLPTYQVTSSRSRRTTSGRHNTLSGSASLASRTTQPTAPRSLISSAPNSGDSWPVKVTINSIDYNTMTLSGTMEAFNVPRKSLPPAEASITTFLEGEIIDFNRYTLETKSFSAGADVDSTYWRKLEPFKELSDKEIVRKLISVKWLREELGTKWILMRWKEKCFITPSDAQSGLTISGFYYVSLRRSDGHIEGLYYDPSSTPYQHLRLMPEKKVFPAYEFR